MKKKRKKVACDDNGIKSCCKYWNLVKQSALKLASEYNFKILLELKKLVLFWVNILENGFQMPPN
jgi:hypothetical protein